MSQMQDQEDAAKAAIVRRFREVAQAFFESEERQKAARAQVEAEGQTQQSLLAVSNDCHAAARLLGFDLIAALAAFSQVEANAAIHSAPPPQQQVIAPPQSIADSVLALTEAAYPEPVRAAWLQAEIEKQRGARLHFKTIGMSLYRLSKQGLVERKGQKDWVFVPESHRTKKSGVSAPDSFEDLLG